MTEPNGVAQEPDDRHDRLMCRLIPASAALFARCFTERPNAPVDTPSHAGLWA